MHQDIDKVLINQQELQAKITQLAQTLTRDYQGKNPVFVGVMKGVVMFFADIVKQIDTHCQIDFMWISSYKGAASTGNLMVRQDVSQDLKGRHVVILEDIYDTGRSLTYVYDHLLAKEPASLKICTLLDKPEGRMPGVTLKADYVGFEVPNEFVVGYGLDYNEYYRNLPYIGILKPQVYTK